MRLATYAFAVLAGGLSLAAFFTSGTLNAAPMAGDRPWALLSADVGVTEDEFRTCFAAVRPDTGHNPSAATQHMNKARLLPCLQAANPEITNQALDAVMDQYRPEGPNGF